MEQKNFILFARNQHVLSELTKQIDQNSIIGSVSFDHLESSPSNLLPPEARIDGLEQYAQGGGY